MAFNLFKKKHQKESNPIVVKSPVDGQAVPLEQIPDEVFSTKVLGDGIAVIPQEADALTVYSPISGTISLFADTCHAVGLTTPEGVELLLHFGLDTVNLNGEGFTPRATQGEKIKAGQPLMDVDLTVLKKNKLNPITILVISDTKDYTPIFYTGNNVSAGKEVVIELNK